MVFTFLNPAASTSIKRPDPVSHNPQNNLHPVGERVTDMIMHSGDNNAMLVPTRVCNYAPARGWQCHLTRSKNHAQKHQDLCLEQSPES
mmetsp:Transcript_14103/g.38121  ORF Transcript_14103/g.38121 Transcript_14103/m.38121 type:complete len:89 (+) Transcript_14103:296-562(+)